MHATPRIPEVTQRERFIKRVCANRRAYAIAGEEGLARVPSQHMSGREVTFIWSSEAEAARWADVLAENPRVKTLMLAELLGEVLPKLSELRRLIATDWTSESIEGEFEPLDIAERLRIEAFSKFVASAQSTGSVYILEDRDGPAMLVSATRADQLLLPCWAERETAELRCEGPWASHIVSALSLEALLSQTLPWLSGRGWAVAPEHVPGVSVLEISPDDLASEFQGR